MNGKNLINHFLTAAVVITVLFIALANNKVIRREIENLREEIRAEDPRTLQDWDEQIKTAEERKWELVKDKWIKVSDINSANWYVSPTCAIKILTADWEELLLNASESTFNFTGRRDWGETTDVEIRYSVSRADIINAIRETMDVNEAGITSELPIRYNSDTGTVSE